MPASAYDRLSRPELLSLVEHLDEAVRRARADLERQRDELRAQEDALAESQRLLEASRDRYADLYDLAPVAYVTLSREGLIDELNLTGALLFGVERSRLLGLPFVHLVAPPHRRAFLDHLAACRSASMPCDVLRQLDLDTRRAGRVPVELQTRVGFDPPSFRTVVIDLTERRHIEAARAHADDERRRLVEDDRVVRATSEAKDRFIAMLSHELRAPLTSIAFALGALRRQDLPAATNERLALVERNVQIESRLVDELLDVTRIQRGVLQLDREPVSLHAIVRDVVQMTGGEAAARGIRVVVDAAAEVDRVDADAGRLRQVLWNLLSNALRHTPAGGTVAIGSRNDGTEVCLVVRDTGDGIPPERLGRIFAPFEQAGNGTRGGLGLGLAICKGLVEAHGGTIGVRSEGPGRGTEVLATLPTTDQRPAEVPQSAGRPPGRSLRVLLVEDNPDNADAIAEYLRLHGFTVRIATSVEGAVAVAHEADFDVLVSDVGLPDGTGHDLLGRLGSRPVRAIALSGFGTAADVQRSLDAGFCQHLTKPVDPEALVDWIRRVGDA